MELKIMRGGPKLLLNKRLELDIYICLFNK